MGHKNGNMGRLQRRSFTDQCAHKSQHTRRHRIICLKNDEHFDSMQGETTRQGHNHCSQEHLGFVHTGKVCLQHILEWSQQTSTQEAMWGSHHCTVQTYSNNNPLLQGTCTLMNTEATFATVYKWKYGNSRVGTEFFTSTSAIPTLAKAVPRFALLGNISVEFSSL